MPMYHATLGGFGVVVFKVNVVKHVVVGVYNVVSIVE